MAKHHYDLRKGINVAKIEKIGEKNHSVHLSDGTIEENVDEIIFCIGRTPLVDGIGLEEIGVKLGKRGEILVDDFENTSVENIYAVGDVTDKLQLTPVAIRAGRTLVERIFNNKPTAKMDYQNVPTVIFSHPPIGCIGHNEKTAKAEFGEENIACYKS